MSEMHRYRSCVCGSDSIGGTVMNLALQFLRAGISVIPLEPKGKRPLIQWTEYQTRMPTETEVRGWWAKHPDANIGGVTGKVSGIGVVDCDGPEGIAEAARLELYSPLVSITGKGRQLFYKHAGGNICNSVRKYPGIDIRGDGGYVVLPGSIHPNGKRYQWVGSGNVGLKAHLPEFPAALFDSVVSVKSVNTTGWIAEALEKLDKGNIHYTTIRVLGKLRTKNFSAEDSRAFLLPHIQRVGGSVESLDERIKDVYKRYDAQVEVTEQPSESIEGFMEAITPVEWICKPLIAKGTLGFVAGLPETNKTWLLMDLALECARFGEDGKWLNLFPVCGSRVLFIDQERFKGETQRRFRGMMKDKGIEPKDLANRLFIRCGTTTRLDIISSYVAFRRELESIRPDLVIIDSWAAFQSSDENNRQSVQVVLERIKTLRTEFGCTFLFVDHENKLAFSDQETGALPTYARMAGSIAKPAAAETIFTVRRVSDDTVWVHHTKSSLATQVKTFQVRVTDTENGVKVVGQ